MLGVKYNYYYIEYKREHFQWRIKSTAKHQSARHPLRVDKGTRKGKGKEARDTINQIPRTRVYYDDEIQRLWWVLLLLLSHHISRIVLGVHSPTVNTRILWPSLVQLATVQPQLNAYIVIQPPQSQTDRSTQRQCRITYRTLLFTLNCITQCMRLV